MKIRTGAALAAMLALGGCQATQMSYTQLSANAEPFPIAAPATNPALP